MGRPVTDEPSSRLFLVRGRVQGVGFRHFVWRAAVELEIGGWVRNREDGSVEVAAWGSDVQLDALRASLNEGPRWSQVDSVIWEPPQEFEAPAGRFSIRT
ncbi:MAG: acylphosphatase [Acidobacteria bacterium]|nr:MAG: acylphosphatase [Acidobacteriota bacterium]